jgi:hypothetical protein
LQLEGTLLAQNNERDVMEFWLANSMIAFASKRIGTASLDVWEKNSFGGLPFKYAASFMTEVDARFFLAAKYPHAVEKMIVENTSNGDEEVASRLSVPRPKPLHGLRDNDCGSRKPQFF